MTIQKASPCYIIVQMPRVQTQEGTLKAAREKYSLEKSNLTRTVPDLSAEILKPEKTWIKSLRIKCANQGHYVQQSYHLKIGELMNFHNSNS